MIPIFGNEWCTNNSAKEKSYLRKVSKFLSNPMVPMLKELEDLMDLLKTIKEGLIIIQELTNRLLD